MEGKRVYSDNDKDMHLLSKLEYTKYKDIWYAKTPNGMVANLKSHKVVEHENGTITVSPSIMCRNHTLTWHGYLENGKWREC